MTGNWFVEHPRFTAAGMLLLAIGFFVGGAFKYAHAVGLTDIRPTGRRSWVFWVAPFMCPFLVYLSWWYVRIGRNAA